MTGNQAVEMILNPKTTEGTRQGLRRRVYRVFDDMFEEATGKRPRRNQGVWDALERLKKDSVHRLTPEGRSNGGGQVQED